MQFSVDVAIFLICSTLIEAVPTPQIKSVPKQPWRPKAIREKEASEAAARAAEEVARAAEEAARASTERTTEIAEDVTEIVQGAIAALNEIMEVTTLLAETVTDNENDSSTVTEEPSDTNTIVSVTATTQKNIVESSLLPTSENKLARKFVSSASEKPEFTTQKTAAQILGVGDETVCRLSLRGKPCACRFEKTCRCDCGRITADKQDSAGNREKPSKMRSHRIRFSKLNKPSVS